MTGNKWYLSVVLVCMALAVPGCWNGGPAPVRIATGQSIDLSGPWRIVPADNDEARLPGFDDSGSPLVSIPGKWDRFTGGGRDMTSTIWLRKKFHAGENMWDRQMVLRLGAISIADETYVNGTFVGATGTIPGGARPLDYDFQWHRDRTYLFNGSLLRPGVENVIAVRVFSHYINGIKGAPVLYTMNGWKGISPFSDYLPSMNNIMPLLLTLVLGLVLIVITWGKVTFRVYFFATLFVVNACGIYLLFLGIPSFSDGLLRYRMFFSIYSLIDLFLLLAVWDFFKVKSKWPLAFILVCLVLVHVLIFAAPDTVSFVRYAKNAVLIFLIICVGYAMAIFIKAFHDDPRRYWIIVPLAFFIVISAADTYYLIATDQMYRISFLFILRIIALGIGVLFYFLFDYRSIEKERDSLARALMKKTRELRQAKSQAPAHRKKEDPRDIIHRVVEYIDVNFSETYDRVGLAEKFGLNEDYMGQVFKKVTGTNITTYINNRRIEAACQLLDETDSKVIDIAFHVGFDNLTYFYRNFRNKTGFNPTEYRSVKRKGFLDIDLKNEGEYY